DNLSALRHYEYVINNSAITEEYFKDAFKLLDIYLSLGNFEEFKCLLEKVSQYENILSPLLLSSYYNLLSERDAREGKPNDSEKHLKKSLRISEASKDLYGTARALLNLVGRVYGPTGRYEEGKKCLERLLSLPKFDGDAVFRVVALMNLGSIAKLNEEYSKAVTYYLKGLNLCKRKKMFFRETAFYSNLAILSYQRNIFGNALKYSEMGINNSKIFSQKDLSLDLSLKYGLCLWAKGEMAEALILAEKSLATSKLSKNLYQEGYMFITLGIIKYEQLYFEHSFQHILKSISVFEIIKCPAEIFSAKLEYLRFLKFLGDESTFLKTISKWGGKKNILLDAKKYNLPFSIRAVVDKNPLNDIRNNHNIKKNNINGTTTISDFDACFVFWFDSNNDQRYLHLWKQEIKSKEKFLRWDLKVKWCWAYLSKDLDPPFNPLRLLSKSPGGIFGLRILAILYKNYLKKGNKSLARKIRKRFLNNIYTAKINSDENIWNCILKDKDILFAIKGE
ncbi:MAG: tetratricopeptide repeat protein, partial [Acidobacteria bacterium]|nr:tetratricopeptide repeat protein [Acidobacteriota bacterium]